MNSHYTLQANDLLTTHYNPNVHLLLCTITNSIPTFNIFCSSQRAQALCTSGHIQPMFPLNSWTLSRAIIGAPPASVEAMISLASLSADLLTYVQLASSNIFQKRLYKGVNASSCMASVLRSNFYRRWLRGRSSHGDGLQAAEIRILKQCISGPLKLWSAEMFP